MPSLIVLNGPNLNLLGTRQPEVYGSTTLDEVRTLCEQTAHARGYQLSFEQSNHEGVLIDHIHASRGKHDGIILNAGAYTHTSVALMDAILSCEIPTIEIHLSNVHAREPFRQQSYIAKAALGIICGFGQRSYSLAIAALCDHLEAP